MAYRVHRNPEDPTDFFLYELYEDESAYLAHQDSDHFAVIARGQAMPLLADRRREFYTALDGEGEELGGR